MVEINEIVDSYRSAGRISSAYRAVGDKVVFSTDTSASTITARVKLIDPDMNTDDIPDRFVLAAQYWIQYRYYFSIDDRAKAQVFYDMYDTEFAKVRHNRIGSFRIQVSDDI